MKCKDSEIIVVTINDLQLRKSKSYMEQISKEQLEISIEYDVQNKLNQCSRRTRLNYLCIVMLLARETAKSFDKMEKKDINSFLAKRNGSTLEEYKLVLKHFFKWYGKRELVSHLKHNTTPNKLTPDKVWTEDEILQLLKVTDPATKERDQAIIMVMWDLAVEKSVIENLKIKDVYDSGTTMRIKVNGKRRGTIKEFVLECIYSSPYIRRWLNIHPHNKDKEAPLFCQLNERTLGKALHSAFVWELCKKLQKRSGIDKKLHPHLIRHSRATDYAKKGISGDTLAYRLRHTNLITQEKYKHLHNEVHEDRIYEADTGIKRNQLPPPKKVLLSIPCQKCGTMNDPTALYCVNCLFVLNEDMAHLEVAIIDLLRSQWYKDIKRDIKRIEDKGFKIPYEKIEIGALARAFQKLKDEARKKPNLL